MSMQADQSHADISFVNEPQRHTASRATVCSTEEAWNLVRRFALEMWGQPAPNGWETWQQIKAVFAGASTTGHWILRPEAQLVLEADNLAKLEALEAPESDRAVDAHFFAQLLRLPRKECTPLRLLQVAYNVGQLLGSGALARLGPEFSLLFEEQRLGDPSHYFACPCNDNQHFVSPALLEQLHIKLSQI